MCYEDMDMREFKDEQSGTATCHKLECGHAFHTKCIIEFLTKTESKCPCCNNHKTADQKLTEAAISKKFLGEIKRSNQFKVARQEVHEAREEYIRITKQLKDEAKAWITNRAIELKLHENRKYYFSTISACKASANEVSKSLGAKHVGALLKYVGGGPGFRHQNTFEEFLFGKQHWWQVYRFKHPRFTMSL
jgi:hypothetical protein